MKQSEPRNRFPCIYLLLDRYAIRKCHRHCKIWYIEEKKKKNIPNAYTIKNQVSIVKELIMKSKTESYRYDYIKIVIFCSARYPKGSKK